ncbi:MAG: hypothetical protein JWO38_1561 [Gemmataceae bacterium]|nr:hypothetical protein [Gemmataceae bacterium]
MAIEWTDTEPETGEKRFVRAEKFARKWLFMIRFRRRTEWDRTVTPTRTMWETLLDAMERRYRRREGVTDEDLAAVRKILAGFKPAPRFDGEKEITHRVAEGTEEKRTEEEEI